MLISEAIAILVKSELKQLAIKDDTPGLIGFINQGVTEIYKRFDLWKETATVTMADGVKTYTINEDDANVSLDGDDDHEFLTILTIFDQEEEEIHINIDDSDYKISVPRFNVLRIKNPVAGDTLEITYRAAPKYMLEEEETIPLPIQFMEPLFHYVGYRAHSSVNGDIKAENNTHFMRFDQSCKRIEMDGLRNSDSMEIFKLEQRGFV